MVLAPCLLLFSSGSLRTTVSLERGLNTFFCIAVPFPDDGPCMLAFVHEHEARVETRDVLRGCAQAVHSIF